MYVNAPALPSNGTRILPHVTKFFDSVGHATLADAISYQHPSPTYLSPGIKGVRTRNLLSSGGLPSGGFKPTDYYSLSVECDFSPYWTRRVFRYPVGGGQFNFSTTHREVNFGWIGGADTGAGNPWEQYCRSFGSLPNRAIISNLENRSRTEVLLKARHQKLDLSETLVDLDSTVLMIARSASAVIRALQAVRRGDYKNALHHLGIKSIYDARKLPKQLADQWLALQYGWLPLLNDIYSGVQFVNEGLGLPTARFSVTRRLSEGLPFYNAFFLNATWLGEYIWEGSDTSSASVDVETKYYLRIRDATLAYLTGIGLDNPAYVAWVSLPYTFVLDWLLPIGDWLQGISAPLGLTFESGYTSVRTSSETRISVRLRETTGSAVTVWRSPPCVATAKHVELTRTAFTSFPVTVPYFRFPFSNPKRIASAAALITARRA